MAQKSQNNMRGHRHYDKQLIRPDSKYNSMKVAKFINYVMRQGKKGLATKIVYQALDIVKDQTQKNALEVFETAIKNVEPVVEVRPRRVGGATYQVPMEVRPNRRLALAMRWIIQSAGSRQGQTMAKFLSEELMNAYNQTGTAMAIRQRMHKMAEANRAFAHFARF